MTSAVRVDSHPCLDIDGILKQLTSISKEIMRLDTVEKKNDKTFGEEVAAFKTTVDAFRTQLAKKSERSQSTASMLRDLLRPTNEKRGDIISRAGVVIASAEHKIKTWMPEASAEASADAENLSKK